MSRRKHLTFKKPNSKKMKLIGIIFLVSFILFPGVRYNTGEAIHLTADLIQRTAR